MLTNREADEEVQLAIDLTALATRLHVLPQAGGLLDQDYYYIKLLRAGIRAFEKKEEQEYKKAKSDAKSRSHR